MATPCIVPIVEGYGDVVAVPALLRRILNSRLHRYDLGVDSPLRCGGITSLRKTGELERFGHLAAHRKGCAGVLVVLDLDDGCPVDVGRELAARLRATQLPVPTAIVLACCEFEAWFLASPSTFKGEPDFSAPAEWPADPEQKRGAKEWIAGQFPKHLTYKETEHQPRYASMLDIDEALERSRSFRRLLNAVTWLTYPPDPSGGLVSPAPRRVS